MKTNYQKFQSLLHLANTNFKTLKPKPNNHGYTVPVFVSNYSESMFVATDIVKLCMIAIRAEEEDFTVAAAVNPRINISGILEIALQFFPLEEMEVLDELQRLLEWDKENEINNTIL